MMCFMMGFLFLRRQHDPEVAAENCRFLLPSARTGKHAPWQAIDSSK
jgi:hypothetical protein